MNSPNTSSEVEKEVIEVLADIEHQRWADWQKWCHKVLRESNPSPEQGDILERWDRQIETPYSELSETEKESDREQVRRYLPIIQDLITQSEIKGRINALEELPITEIKESNGRRTNCVLSEEIYKAIEINKFVNQMKGK